MENFREKASQFWTSFEEQESQITDMIDSSADQQTVIDKVDQLLLPLFGSIPFAIGYNEDTALEQKYELVLSPDGNQLQLRILRYWKQFAFEELTDRWVFRSSRPASPKAADSSIEMAETKVSAQDFTIYYDIVNERQHVNINIYAPKLSHLNNNTRTNLLFIFLDNCISEVYTMNYIGSIDFSNNELDTPNVKISELKQLIDDTIINNDWTQHTEDDLLYSGYSLQPQAMEEGWNLREDIYIGSSSCLPVINAFHDQDRATIELQQSKGIHIGYVFYTNTTIPQESLVDERSKIEDKLLEDLEQYRILEVLGGATGEQFSYIDLIIYDYEAFMAYTANMMSEFDYELKGYAPFILGAAPIVFK